MTAPYDVTVAANGGAVGGGEVMLLHLALAARDLGHRVLVVAPDRPDDVLTTVAAHGFDTVAVTATGRRAYVAGLRRWDRAHRTGLLWCNGLVPALATAGHPGRVVHLHKLPAGPAQRASLRVARAGAARTVVPSRFLADALPGDCTVLANWTSNIAQRPPRPAGTADRVHRIGFLGRLVREKGLVPLAGALTALEARTPGRYHLVLAGEPTFSDPAERDEIERALRPVEHLVERRGWVRPEELFAEVDLTVVPSVAPESFGLVVAEAMAAGVPVVVSDAGALPEVAGPGHPWLVPRGDAAALADAIERVVAATDVRATAAARTRWERTFSPEAGRAGLAGVLSGLDVLPDTAPARDEEALR